MNDGSITCDKSIISEKWVPGLIFCMKSLKVVLLESRPVASAELIDNLSSHV